MDFYIGSLYSEPKVCFEISHKVRILIVNKLRDYIFNNLDLFPEKKNRALSLHISTRSGQDSVKVIGPDLDTRNNMVIWTLFLPFKKIAKYKDQRKPFIKNIFKALKELFKIYSLDCGILTKIEKEVRKEVLHNVDYIYDEEVIPEPDLSFLNLD